MATTMFYEGVLTDKMKKDQHIQIEFGRSSYYDGESLVYLKFGEAHIILDEAQGRELLDAMSRLQSYLGHREN